MRKTVAPLMKEAKTSARCQPKVRVSDGGKGGKPDRHQGEDEGEKVEKDMGSIGEERQGIGPDPADDLCQQGQRRQQDGLAEAVPRCSGRNAVLRSAGRATRHAQIIPSAHLCRRQAARFIVCFMARTCRSELQKCIRAPYRSRDQPARTTRSPCFLQFCNGAAMVTPYFTRRFHPWNRPTTACLFSAPDLPDIPPPSMPPGPTSTGAR